VVMGAPKQKWTAEEEYALKAGVKKHGIGKWRNILKDPEFSMALRLRSNIDLKDKWRNMSVTGSGGSISRERAKLGNKNSRRLSLSKVLEEEQGEYTPVAISPKLEDSVVIDVTPIASSSVPLKIKSKGTKKPLKRLGNMILEAITQLHEYDGSSNTSIAMYIEAKCRVPPDFQRQLSAKLKTLVDSGNLIKVNRNYKLPPSSTALQEQTATQAERDQAMTIQEAADSAARAVAEAEIAEAEAEEAIRKAEKIEADAQAAQAFVDVMILHIKNRNSAPLMIQA